MLSHAQKRAKRLKAARKKATHTIGEWIALVEEFRGKCVRCFCECHSPVKDHIVPIYQGGSDGINNIQPLCHRCNSAKGPERTNWVEFRRVENR